MKLTGCIITLGIRALKQAPLPLGLYVKEQQELLMAIHVWDKTGSGQLKLCLEATLDSAEKLDYKFSFFFSSLTFVSFSHSFQIVFSSHMYLSLLIC